MLATALCRVRCNSTNTHVQRAPARHGACAAIRTTHLCSAHLRAAPRALLVKQHICAARTCAQRRVRCYTNNTDVRRAPARGAACAAA